MGRAMEAVRPMSAKERFEAALRLRPVDRLPVASPLGTAIKEIVDLAGCGFPQAFHDARAMICLSLAASRYAGWESVRVPFDVNIDAQAFGAKIGNESELRPPGIIGRVVEDYEMLDRLVIPDPLKAGRSPLLLSAVRILAEREGDLPVICAMHGPLTLSAQLRGEEALLMDLLSAPNEALRLLDKAMRWGREFAGAAVEAGANVIIILDGTSSGDILGPEQYARFSMPFQRQLVASLGDRVPSILHICGDITSNLNLIVSTEVDAISIGQVMDLGWVKEQVDGRAAIVGNVSPTNTLLNGTPEVVRAATVKCILQGADVPSPGCGFAFETPLASMRAMVQTIRSYRRHIDY